jgi:protein gp37
MTTIPNKFTESTWQQMSRCPQHTFLILTKRPHRMLEFVTSVAVPKYGILSNVWFGCTVVNQQEVDAKIPVFLQVPGKKFLSIEPMLGAVSLRWISAWNGMATKPREWGQTTDQYDGLRLIDAVILGGETGPGARPMHPDWVRSVRDQCAAAKVPFFLKFLNKKDGRVLDGKTHDELPWRDYDADRLDV